MKRDSLVEERGLWLAAFIALSLLLHMIVVYGSRGWHLFGNIGAIAQPQRGEIEVALQQPKQEAPHRSETTPLPQATVAPKAARPTHNDVPVPFQPQPRVIRGVAPKSAPHPVSRTDRSPIPVEKALPVPSDRAPQIAGGKFPDKDLTPLPLGVQTGDKLLTPKPQPRILAPVAPNLKPLGPQEIKSGAGSGAGETPTQVAKKDDEVLAAGNGGATQGAGAAQGGSTGRGADEGGNSAGMTRGVPFGDPGGVLSGGNVNGGGGHGGGPGGSGNGRAYGGGGGAGAPVHVVYLVDISESMNEHDKIGKARAALRQALSELQPEDSFNIIYFADDQHIFSARKLVPATPENIERAGEFQANLRPRGATNYSGALDKAFSLSDVTHIILISDGAPTLGVGISYDDKNKEYVIEVDDLLDWIRQRNRNGVHILTLGLNLGRDQDGKELLHDIAAQNDGTFRAIDLR